MECLRQRRVGMQRLPLPHLAGSVMGQPIATSIIIIMHIITQRMVRTGMGIEVKHHPLYWHVEIIPLRNTPRDANSKDGSPRAWQLGSTARVHDTLQLTQRCEPSVGARRGGPPLPTSLFLRD